MRSELGERIFREIGEDGVLEQLESVASFMLSTVRFMQRRPPRSKKDDEMTWSMLADECGAVLVCIEVLGLEPNPDAVGGKLIGWAKAIGIEVDDEGIKGPPGAPGTLPDYAAKEDK